MDPGDQIGAVKSGAELQLNVSSGPGVSSEKPEPAQAASDNAAVNGGNVKLSREQASAVAEQLQHALNQVSVQFRVSLGDDRTSGSLRFKVIDKQSGKVVREFPPEEGLKLVHQLRSGAKTGAIFNEKG